MTRDVVTIRDDDTSCHHVGRELRRAKRFGPSWNVFGRSRRALRSSPRAWRLHDVKVWDGTPCRYTFTMSRWPPDARGRLETAALELFVEQGFGETTVPQIAARAGLTTRSFFRHFADKREVLFAGEADFPAALHDLLAPMPTPRDLTGSLRAVLAELATSDVENEFEFLRTRRAVIRTDESLRERELRKQELLADAIRGELVARDMDAVVATLAARTIVTIHGVALDRWLDQPRPTRPMSDLLADTLSRFTGSLVGSVHA